MELCAARGGSSLFHRAGLNTGTYTKLGGVPWLVRAHPPIAIGDPRVEAGAWPSRTT
jgi:hypothetical protein